MTFKEAKETYYKFTELSSDIIRKLALGGLAIVWLFEHDKHLDPKWKWCLILFALCLTVDLLQYLFVSICYKTELNKTSKEVATLEEQAEKDRKPLSQETIDNHETNPPKFINSISQFAFYTKGVLLLIGYVILIVIFWTIVFP